MSDRWIVFSLTAPLGFLYLKKINKSMNNPKYCWSSKLKNAETFSSPAVADVAIKYHKSKWVCVIDLHPEDRYG